jgi:hypothetical protein
VVRGREEHAREVVRGERDALLRQARSHRVHRLEAGDQPVDAAEVLLHLRDPRIGVVRRALGRRPRVHDLPRHRHPVRRVLREKLVQDGRAGARQTDHEDRPADLPGPDLGMPRVRVHHAQAVREKPHDVGARDQAAEDGKVRLALEAIEQPAEGLAEALVAEVGEAGRPRGARAERRLVERDERHARGAKRAPHAVQDAEGERAAKRGGGHEPV